MDSRQALAILLILVLVLNGVFFAIRRSNEVIFWATIGIVALLAYKVLPKSKRKK